jgi:HlyD family secretion protein
MKKHFVNLKKFAINYKKTSFIIAIVLIVSIYYTVTSLTGKTTSNQYFLGAVKTGSISSTVTGTGQISTSNQIDLKAKVTADVINIPIKEGQEVKAGTTIIQLDGRDAEIALESARIAYQKLTKPADKVTLLQAQSSYESAKDAEKKAVQLQAKIMKKVQDVEALSKEKYTEVVDDVLAYYEKTQEIAKKEVPEVRSMLLKKWKTIESKLKELE